MHNIENVEFLRKIFDNINEAIVVHDDKNSIILFNRKTVLLLGLTEDQLLGKTSFDFYWKAIKLDGTDFTPEEHPAVITNRTGESCKNIIMGVLHSDKTLIWVSVNSHKVEVEGKKYIIVTFYDVSNIIELNKEVVKNNKELDLIVSSLDDVVIEINHEGKIFNCWVSDLRKPIIDTKGAIGKNISEVFPARCVVKFNEAILRVISEKDYQYIECEDPFNKENNDWYSVKIFPIKDSENLVSLTIRDISPKKKIEAKLKESETLWKFALEGSGDGIWDWNPQTGEVFYSDKTREILGYCSDELPNDLEVWREIVHPDDRKYLSDAIKFFLEENNEYLLIELRLRCKDGSYKWILWRGMVVEKNIDGKLLRVVGTQTDIQTLKNKEGAVEISKQTYTSAFKHSGIGKALVSSDGKWIEVNDALCEFLGYEEDELKKLTFQDLTHPEDLDKDMAYVKRMLNKEIDFYQMEKRYIHKNKNYVWALLTVSLVWNMDGTPRFFISQIQDISEMKKLISDLETKNQQLVITGLDLQQKVKQLEEFNRIVAHNIRGPAGNIKILLNEYSEATDQNEKRVYFDYLRQSSEQLLNTLTELMDILEVKMNKKIKFENCDLYDLISKIKNQLHVIIVREKAEFELDLKVAHIYYPNIYLESILFNLISNALKYCKKNILPVIKVSTYRNHSGDIILEVEDNGLGIDLKKYGNQVFKLHKVFHPGYDSKGVGLFMTKNQIETFGGTIDIESEKDVGTKFIIKF